MITFKPFKLNYTTPNGENSNITENSIYNVAFNMIPTYFNRDYSTVCEDQAFLWNNDKMLSVRFIFYLRMVNRTIHINNANHTEKTQYGRGLRDESYKRLIWLATFHPSVFYKNVWLLPLVGSWKDIWMLMYYDITLGTNVINHNIMFELLKQGYQFDEQRELIKKYMPRIKTTSKLKTNWLKISNKLAIEFANYMQWSIKEYNKIKSTGVAHDFQKNICNKEFDRINWERVPLKVLQSVSNKDNKLPKLNDYITERIEKYNHLKFNIQTHHLGSRAKRIELANFINKMLSQEILLKVVI